MTNSLLLTQWNRQKWWFTNSKWGLTNTQAIIMNTGHSDFGISMHFVSYVYFLSFYPFVLIESWVHSHYFCSTCFVLNLQIDTMTESIHRAACLCLGATNDCATERDQLASRNNTLVWMYALAFITTLFVTLIHTLFLLSFLCFSLSLHSFSLLDCNDQTPLEPPLKTTSSKPMHCMSYALRFEFHSVDFNDCCTILVLTRSSNVCFSLFLSLSLFFSSCRP
jgi:hypothetical protein